MRLLSLAKGVVFIPIGIAAFAFFIALVTSDATLSDLALPCAGVIGVWLVLLGILWVASRVYRIGEKISINRMFAGEIWECWQFDPADWQDAGRSGFQPDQPKG